MWYLLLVSSARTTRLGTVRAVSDDGHLVLTWPLWRHIRLPLAGLAVAVLWPAVFFMLAPVLPDPWGILVGFGPSLAAVLFAAPVLGRELHRRRATITRGQRSYELPRKMLLDPFTVRRALPWMKWINRKGPGSRPAADLSPFLVAVTGGPRPSVLLLWLNASGQISPIFCERGESREQCRAFAQHCAGFLDCTVLDEG